MTKYYRVDGMMYPFWYGSPVADYPKPGQTTWCWNNRDADTDMGMLYDNEFAEMFPDAVEVTKEEFYA